MKTIPVKDKSSFIPVNQLLSFLFSINKNVGFALIVLLFCSIVQFSFAQNVKGIVIYHDETMDGMEMPLGFASVHWLGSEMGVITDGDGLFLLAHPDSVSSRLVVSYVGYSSDTVSADFTKSMKIVLNKAGNLKTVTITDNKLSYISGKPVNQLNIGSGELAKAACCNLGEAFQTTPQVDVTTTDGVTGARQIQLLGLTGNYTQILTENTPQITGLSRPFGLDYIPGPWIESMQLTQGVGSVVNGYDGLNGQINAELKKPNTVDKLYLNVYGNSFGRLEGNVSSSFKFNHSLSTIFLVHADGNNYKMDVNHDGFLDLPLGHQFHFANRWLYTPNDSNGFQYRFGYDVLTQTKTGGQTNFSASDNPLTSPYYGISINTTREGAYAKIGYVSKEKKYHTAGLILSAFNHQQDAYFGRTAWNATEQNFNANFIYQTIINNTNNQIRFGASYLYDNETEHLSFLNGQMHIDNPISQSVPGAYSEYTYTGTKLTAIAGVREDYHNQYGFIFTTRGFLKYAITKTTSLKLSAGSAFHQPDIISENASLLASSRQWVIESPLQAERAWNTGAAFQQTFYIGNHEGDVILNAYHTWFTNQVIVDLNADPSKVLFYNLNGNSFADNFLAQFDYAILKNINIKLAYRYNNVKQQEQNGLEEKTFVVQNKFYGGADYNTNNKHWKFSINWQYYGPQHLTNTQSNPEAERSPTLSPSYQMVNAQVTFIYKSFQFYAGGENLLNQTQQQVITDAQNPFGKYFDASMIWGPVTGSLFYTGIRYSIK